MPDETQVQALCEHCNAASSDLVENLCDECRGSCYHCDAVVPATDLISGPRNSSRYYCRTCHNENFTTCDSCAATIRRENAYSPESEDSTYCEDCYPYSCCRGCDHEYHHDDLTDGYCDACQPEEQDDADASAIVDYDCKPTPEFKRAGYKGNEFYGIELEVEQPTCTQNLKNHATKVRAALPCAYVKRDGSLNNGFEIVTHPCSWVYLQKHGLQFSTELKRLAAAGFRSYETGTAGLHVHVSREALTGLQLYKLCRLMFEYPTQWHRVSRRTSEQLRRWASVYIGKNGTASKKDFARWAKDETSNGVRYLALNLENDATIEFRLFRGTLDPEAFWAILETVRACLAYCRDASCNAVSPAGLVAYMRRNAKEYSHGLTLWARRLPVLNTEQRETEKGS